MNRSKPSTNEKDKRDNRHTAEPHLNNIESRQTIPRKMEERKEDQTDQHGKEPLKCNDERELLCTYEYENMPT
jgi:hypothetical protein